MTSNFGDFELCFPSFAEHTIRWEQHRNGDLTVELDDGSRFYYTFLEQTIRKLPDDPDNMTDVECKREYGIRLKKLMRRRGVTQSELSEMTGITQPQLSNYISGKRSPTFCIADKIAKALKCSIEDFRYLDFEEDD